MIPGAAAYDNGVVMLHAKSLLFDHGRDAGLGYSTAVYCSTTTVLKKNKVNGANPKTLPGVEGFHPHSV